MDQVAMPPALTVDALHPLLLDPLLTGFLREDLAWGDLTTTLTIEPGQTCQADFGFREAGIVAGLPVVARVFQLVDPALEFRPMVEEGTAVPAGTVAARVSGSARSILAAERVALNLFQRLSAIATATRKFVEKLEGTRARLLDTRKTMPGMRPLERYAVRIGGATNHRYCLSDAILIKDNHIALAGSIGKAVASARAGAPATVRIEVETENLFQVQEALQAGADIIMLDNMGNADLEQAVALIAGRATVEASGGITLERVASVARTGVDFISTGAVTRLAGFLDIGLDIAGT